MNCLSCVLCFLVCLNVLRFYFCNVIVCSCLLRDFNYLMSLNDMLCVGGIVFMMWFFVWEIVEGLNVCFIGIFLDFGILNRFGIWWGFCCYFV